LLFIGRGEFQINLQGGKQKVYKYLNIVVTLATNMILYLVDTLLGGYIWYGLKAVILNVSANNNSG